ncbi:unnamed protein product [Staurois parvus]|uniref:Uncharacterized protein n=1 Tax=Staurois parvus TaxID=386267 RepID=A0ABN9DK42_9NEOB|nr:unnamed protein product [Staurois parvus]
MLGGRLTQPLETIPITLGLIIVILALTIYFFIHIHSLDSSLLKSSPCLGPTMTRFL